MSGRIKFRAWDIEEKAYVGDNQLGFSLYEIALSPFEHADKLKKLKFEQYTGLKDKNGKEIYERDIVKVELYSRLYQVSYRKWDCSFILENDEDEDIVHIFNCFPDKYEVIGNIHENQELLGGKE